MLLVKLPVSWLLPLVPNVLHCRHPEGSAWAGRCGDASLVLGTSAPLALGSIQWDLHPWQLARGRIALDIRASQGTDSVAAEVRVFKGGIDVFGGQGTLSLSRLPPRYVRGWRGTLHVDALHLRTESGRLRAIDGDIRLLDLQSPQAVRWGSFRLNLPPAPAGAPSSGQFSVLTGTLQASGTATLDERGDWQLDAAVRPTKGADAALVAELGLLGPPDTSGLRRLSVAGSQGS